jgi:tetratricopeptide (TPR) repeat protein
MERLLTIVCCVGLSTALGGEPTNAPPLSLEQQFTDAYQLLIRADEARDADQASAAARLYRDALNAYVALARRYPDVQASVVRFRAAYCDEQMEALIKQVDRPSSLPREPVLEDAQFTEPRWDTPPPAPSPLGNSAEDLDLPTIRAKTRWLLGNGDTAGARRYLMDAMNVYPDDASVRLLMGVVQCQAGSYKDASYVLEQLAEELPAYADAHMALGAAYFGLGRSSDAERELTAALRINPDIPEAHYNLVHVLLGKKPADRDAARQHYRRMLQLGGAPDPQVETQLE